MQLYPKEYSFNTHEVLKNTNAFLMLPSSNSRATLSLKKGLKLVILEEHVGYGCKYHKVKIIDRQFAEVDGFNEEIWVKKTDLKAIIPKKEILFSASKENNPNPNASFFDWTTKEPFIPFVDQKNAKLSVVVESDFESIVSTSHLDIILKNAFYTGMDILLQSRGLKSNKNFIDQLTNDYFFYGSVEEYHVDTRKCIPIKLLVSIPLRFLNAKNVESDDKTTEEKIINKISFNSLNIIEKIDKLISVFIYFSNEINDFLDPNGVITAFSLEYEIFNLKKFLNSFIRILNEAGYEFNETRDVNYEIGLSSDNKIISVSIIKAGESESIPYSIISKFSNIEPLNSRRTLNYILNINKINSSFTSYRFKEFAEIFIKYPNVEFIKKNISIDVPSYSDTAKTQNFNQEDIKKAFKQAERAKFVLGSTKALFDSISNIEQASNIVDAKNKQEKLVSQLGIQKFYSETSPSSGKSPLGNLKEQIGYQDNLKGWKKALKIAATIFKKIRLQEILIKSIICSLRKMDPNDPNAQKYIASLGPELNQWLSYLLFIANDPSKIKSDDLKGLVRSGAQSATPLLISSFEKRLSEEQLELFYKILTAISARTGGVLASAKGIRTIPVFKVPKPTPVTSLMETILNALINAVIQLATQQIFQALDDLVQKSLCADESNPADFPGLNNLFRNPLDTSAVGKDNNSSKPQRESQNIKKDRIDALNDSGILSNGQNPEDAVDLLQQLLNDISCVLTPREVCALLADNTDQNVVNIIKSIIRRKYLPELQELLEEQKIKLLFKELGKRIDTSICDEINQAAEFNPNAPSLECSPQQLKLRESILNDKLPKELINDQLKAFNKRRADEIEDAIQKLSNNSEIDITAGSPLFCGNGVEGLVSPLDDVSIDGARKILDTLFSPVYSAFNSDSRSWSTNYVKTEKVPIKNEDGEVIFTKDINVVNKNLYLNLLDDSSSTLTQLEKGYRYQFFVNNKFVSPQIIEQIDAMPETEGVDKQELKNQIVNILAKPLWTLTVEDSYEKNSFSYSIKRMDMEYIKGELERTQEYAQSYDRLEGLVKNAKVVVRDIIGFDDDAIDPSTISGEITEAFFDTIKNAITNLKMFSKTESKSVFKNENNNIKFDLVEGIFGIAEGDEEYTLASYIDGSPYIKDFSLHFFPSLQQQVCGVDPHYLGIKKLKNDAMQEYKDTICSQEDNQRPNQFELAALGNAIKLMFRVQITDYLTKGLPIFSSLPIETLINNSTFIEFLEKLIREEMKIFGEKFNKDFEKYTELYFEKLIKDGKIEGEYFNIDNFDSGNFVLKEKMAYKYFLKKELIYCVKKISKVLKEKRLLNNPQEIENLFASNFLKIYDLIPDDANIDERPKEKFYLEEYINNLPSDEIFGEGGEFAYETLDDFFEDGNDEGQTLAGVRLVYQKLDPRDGFFEQNRASKIVLFKTEIPTGKTMDELRQTSLQEIGNIRNTARESFFASQDYKTFTGIIPANDMMTFYLIYSILCTIDDQEIYTTYLSTKEKVFSLIVTLINDKDYRNELYAGTGSRDETRNLLAKLSRSPFPMEEIRKNPGLISAGAMDIIKAMLKIPLDIVKYVAENTDPNISVASKISSATQIPFSIAWSLMSDETKKDLMKKAPVFWKRLRDNQRVLPVFIPSFSLFFPLIFPLGAGIAYLGITIPEEILYTIKLLKEKEEEGANVGQLADSNPSFIGGTVSCNEEIKRQLEKEAYGDDE